MVCTPEPAMLNWIKFVVFAGGGFAFESKIAWRNEPVSLSLVLVTVNVIAGVDVGVGVGVTSGGSAEMIPAPVAAVCGPRGVLFQRFWPNTTIARKMPVKQQTRPIKARQLKKADWEVGFFLIGFLSPSLSRKFGAKFPKIFKATELFQTRITRVVTNLLTMESIGSIRPGSPAAP